MRTKSLIFFFFIILFQSSHSQIEQAQKIVVAVSADWDSTSGAMYLFDKIDSRWTSYRENISVSFGKAGLAWGNGLYQNPDDENRKKEGDKRSPAGIFEFGALYGLDSISPAGVKYPYHQITRQTKCVDDGSSRVYNRIVEEDSLTKDWHSAENMRRINPDYKYVLVVEHNPDNVPGKGSCIFFHINRCPTTGCTSMDEPDMISFLQWLDPHVRTLLIQVPRTEYSRLRQQYGLPNLEMNQ